MDVKDAIDTRRAYRSLDPVEITEEILEGLSKAAQMSPSCFNNQPWRYVFVYEEKALTDLKEALKSGNEWANDASMIIVVTAKKEDDCVIRDRIYYMFDTGMATAFLILRATELGLVAHPIAGFSPSAAREKLNIPEEQDIIAMLIVGKKHNGIKEVLSEKQAESEVNRPERKAIGEIVKHNRWE